MKKLSKLFIILFIIISLTGCTKQTIQTSAPTFVPIVSSIPTEVTIITNPEPQTVNEYQACSFTAKSSNGIPGTWYFISPNFDAQYDIENIVANYAKDLKITVNNDSINLSNIPRQMNGWMIYCDFANGLTTTPVTITVNYYSDGYDPYLN